MEQNKTIKAGGKEYILSAVTGIVASTSKQLETHITGGGGGGSISGGGSIGGSITGGGVRTEPVSGSFHVDPITSSTEVHDQIFLIDNNGKERSFKLSGWDIASREGNRLTILWAAKKGYVIVRNHTTDRTWTDHHLIREMSTRGIKTITLLFAGAFFLLGYITIETLPNLTRGQSPAEIGGTLVTYAVFGLIIGAIVGKIIQYIRANIEVKRVESEILQYLNELRLDRG